MEEKNNHQSTNQYLIPGSIVLAGLFIAAGLYFSGGTNVQNNDVAVKQPANQPTVPAAGNTNAVREVTKEDHIKGDINAPVKIVEYSDYECPFCKRFHFTMNEIMDEYIDSGEVAWVYRHFPLDQLHPKNARKVAAAAECAAEQGGNDMFWKFTDRFMELTPSNDRTDLATVLPQIYGELGLNRNKIESCVKSGKYDAHIQEDVDNAIATGGRGTPWSVVIAANGKTFPLSGAQPKQAVIQLINIAKQEK